MTTKTGYKQDYKGSYIEKDPDATLTYSMDWGTEWLPTGDALASVTYEIETITGDAAPLTAVTSGVQSGLTYVQLSGGTSGEIYTVTANVVTDDGNEDTRRFRVKVEDRYL